MTRRKGTLAIGPLSPGGIGAHWVEPKHNFPAPRVVVNATSTGVYTGESWNLRPGAEAHKRFKSVGC